MALSQSILYNRQHHHTNTTASVTRLDYRDLHKIGCWRNSITSQLDCFSFNVSLPCALRRDFSRCMGDAKQTLTKMISSVTFVVLLLAVIAKGSNVDIWAFDIDNSPAPPPEDEPPFSRNAVRDPSKLKYQVAGIVGGYFAFVVLLGLFLLLVGKPMRRKALSLHDSIATELVKRPKQMLDPSPISPSSSARSWRKWTKTRHVDMNAARRGASPASRHAKSPEETTVETQEMSTNSRSRALSSGATRMPLRLDTSGMRISATQEPATASPRSPYHAIYPPYNTSMANGAAVYGGLGFTNVTPIQETEGHTRRASPVHSNQSRTRRMHRGSRTSLIGRSTSIRSLDISAPMLQPASAISMDYPLSPRYYPELGPAPVPPAIQDDGTMHRPTSLQSTPPLEEEEGAHDNDEYTHASHPCYSSSVYTDPPVRFDSPRPVPHPAPQRQQPPGRQFTPSPPPPSNSTPTRTSPSPKPLPFRLMTSHYSPSTSPTATTTTRTADANTLAAFTATPTRVTFLSPRRDVFNTQTQMQQTPRTGLFVPYTPYMPFTPVTPVTPHLAGRAERVAQRRREEVEVGRGGGYVWEEDRVRSEGELWGEAY